MTITNQDIGVYCGLVGLMFTPFLMIIAYLLEPTYNPLLQTISKLGVTPGGEIIFILSSCIGGISIIVFQYLYFQKLSLKENTIRYARIFGILSGFGLIGVGIIQDYADLIHKSLHWLASVFFFFFTILFIIFLLFFLNSNKNNKNYSIVFYSGFIPVFMASSYMIISFVTQQMIFFNIEFKLNVIWQKFTVLTFISWYLILFVFLRKNEVFEVNI